MLEAGDAGAVERWIERARLDRDALLGTGSAGAAMQELRVLVPNRPGVIAQIALALGEGGVNIGDLALSPSRDNSQGVVSLWIGGEGQAARAGELVAGLGFTVVRA
jgi:prephenate dehydrogenase